MINNEENLQNTPRQDSLLEHELELEEGGSELGA